MLTLGAHMSIAKGFSKAAEQTVEFGCNAMQFFTKSPRGGITKPINQEDAELFQEICKKNNLHFVIAHSSYLLNFAKPTINLGDWMLRNLISDFERLAMFGGKGVVIHVGKSLINERKLGIKNIIENAKKVLGATEKNGLWYIIENTAGQGSEIGYTFEELAEVWEGLKNESPRVKICLDTAHLWGAGYDLSSRASVEKVFAQFDHMIGMKNVACFHFNDSKKPLNSHLDRHENIGDGHIGLEGLAAVARFAEKNAIPLILETPEENKTHLDDVKVVRGLLV